MEAVLETVKTHNADSMLLKEVLYGFPGYLEESPSLSKTFFSGRYGRRGGWGNDESKREKLIQNLASNQ